MTDATPAPRFESKPVAVNPETNEPVEVPKTLLFSLNGREFFIENRARPNLSFGYMHRLRTLGESAAETWMMEQTIGLEGLAALAEFDDMTIEDAENLSKRIRDITMGGAGTSGPKAP